MNWESENDWICAVSLCPSCLDLERTSSYHTVLLFPLTVYSPPNRAPVASSPRPTSNHQLYEGKLLHTDWWRKLVLMRVGRYIMISPTHYYSAWHPESLCGVSLNQLTSTVNGESWKSASVVNAHLVDDPTIRQPGFALPQQLWSLLNRFRTGQGHSGACKKKWLQSVFLRLNYTLQTMMTLPGWPAMAPKCIRQQQQQRQPFPHM